MRKPSAAPAVIAASTPPRLTPRSKAMTPSAAAAIAQTPAARPSMPSDRLTTFITTTSPNAVSGPPRSPKSSRPTNGSVPESTRDPAAHGDPSPRAIWPASFSAGCRSKRSSIAPTAVMTAAAARIPCSSSVPGMTIDRGDRAAGEDRQAAEQRRAAGSQSAAARAVDRAGRAGEARRQRRQRGGCHESDGERRQRVELVEHAATVSGTRGAPERRPRRASSGGYGRSSIAATRREWRPPSKSSRGTPRRSRRPARRRGGGRTA